MPLIKLETSVALEEAKKQDLMAALSKCAAEVIGKPEQYVMVVVGPASILMSGQAGPAAWVDLRSIGGLGGTTNQTLAERICGLLQSKAGISPNRVFINFTEFEGQNWGWNRQTFG